LAIILEVKAGPFTGKQIAVATGRSVVIGRAPDRTQFAVPPDNHMFGVHFAVECGPGGWCVIDRKDTRYLFCPSVRER